MLFIASAFFVCVEAVAQERDTLKVDDPRPLAKALDILGDRYGWVVSYEDPPYEHSSHVVDVTDQVRKASDPAAPRLIRPRGGAFQASYDVPVHRDNRAAIAALITSVIRQFESAGLAGTFAVTEADEGFHVTPTSIIAPDGQRRSLSSLLETRITLRQEPGRKALAALQTIVRELTATSGRKVVLGTVPVNLLVQSSGADGGANVPARALVSTMLANTGSALSWRLFYDPVFQMYVLNVYVVRRPR